VPFTHPASDRKGRSDGDLAMQAGAGLNQRQVMHGLGMDPHRPLMPSAQVRVSDQLIGFPTSIANLAVGTR